MGDVWKALTDEVAKEIAKARAEGRAEGFAEAIDLVRNANPYALASEAGAFAAHHIGRDGAKDVRDVLVKRLEQMAAGERGR